MDNTNNAAALALSPDEMDAIGEVMNISMGSSATAISAMLDKQVIITTPKLTLQKFGTVDYSNLEPAVLVKIRFSEGIIGTNVMLFRNHDMQIILNLLMGNEDPVVDDDFEFDELSMSAACEVMNQMMGAAATALSDILEKPVNITTPVATIVDANHPFESEFSDAETDTDIISISFDLSIKGVMNSNFVSVVPIDLAKSIVSQLMGGVEEEPIPEPPIQTPTPMPATIPQEQPAAAPAPAPVPIEAPAAPVMPQMQQTPQTPHPVPQAPAPQQAAPAPGYPQEQPPQNAPPGYPPQMPYPPYQQMPAGQNGYPQQMPYPYPPYPYPYGSYPQPPQQGQGSPAVTANSPTVKKAQFPDFSQQEAVAHTMNSTNMSLLMNVPLDVSVEIGKTKRKIKEIADFGQGTVLELEKQAGAPVDIIVNGQLLAHGDVVVIGDNFGVRITEIVGTKDLMDSLSNPS